MQTPELVLLGGSNSGKTHYAGQLYGRLRRNSGLLKLRKDQGTPSDISILEEVLRCLAEGRAASHTSAGTWSEILLPLEDQQGHALNLLWPDYAGEQLKTVFDDRIVSGAWQSKVCNAQGWLLLIRLKSETTYPDALAELVNRANGRNGGTTRAGVDANAYWVELLQILLHAGGFGTVARLQHPRLAILLSCYDELDICDEQTPLDILNRHLPLLASFIGSNWCLEAVSVWGLSALGCLLEENSANANFIDEGPEFQGWIVSPEGSSKDADLSKPVAWLLGTQ
ncbi:hypothetical protein RP726_08620 [Candidatus Methylospira mobilis]|uniref:TRAFAC clade GTPase domain-containing protein n=1 Tax=Candidatus Methylospira mobilis TaxID=1808979 RepID=UPI0028EE7E43|nr:hypothetical protein [Candidatus Methylospira mobilis]WNV06454.1 hypothetical protein RP726_08620 [Candidatus Methylospira mobilis]